MHQINQLLLSIGSVIFVLAVPQASFGQTTAANSTIAPTVAGRALFDANCAVCHQASGAGGIHLGNAVSADLRSPRLEETYYHSDSLIQRAILHAKDQNGTPLKSPMPAWSGRLSQQQVDDIITYLHQLRAP